MYNAIFVIVELSESQLRWLKTVSSTFQDLDLMAHYNHSLSIDATAMTKCPITGEHIGIIFVTQ